MAAGSTVVRASSMAMALKMQDRKMHDSLVNRRTFEVNLVRSNEQKRKDNNNVAME